MDQKTKIMVVLLSFQSGRNQEWCEKYLSGNLKSQSKLPLEAAPRVARDIAKQEKIRYLGIYADKILSIVKA